MVVSEIFSCVVSTIIKKFSFDDAIMEDISFLLPENQGSLAAAPVLRLAARFQAAVPEEACDALEEELLDYMLLPSTNHPSVDREESKPTQSAQLCVYWQEIGRMSTVTGTATFPNLTSLVKCILALPVANADTERIFSIVRKVVTDYRTQLEQNTLLVSCKLNNDKKCYELETPSELLSQACTATMEYNRAHSSKCKI